MPKGYVRCVVLLDHHGYKLDQDLMPPAYNMTQGWCLSCAHNGLDVSEEEEGWVDIIMTNPKHPHTSTDHP